MHQADAVVRWTFTLAAGLWAIELHPDSSRFGLQKGSLWTSLALVLGSGFGWYAWLAIQHH